MQNYQIPRDKRTADRAHAKFTRGGKLQPIAMEGVKASESGTLSQQAVAELAPVSGRMYSEITAHVQVVFVPLTAIHELMHTGDDFAGTAEAVRKKLEAGPFAGLEVEHAVSKVCRVNPRSMNGVKMVSEVIGYAHTAAVNHLRKLAHIDTVQLEGSTKDVTPAILSETALHRMNGVLDPDNHVNGAVNLDGIMKITGIGKSNANFTNTPRNVIETDGSVKTYDGNQLVRGFNGGGEIPDEYFFIEEDPENPGQMNLKARMDSESISLRDLHQAREMDRISRGLRMVLDKNPEHGHEMISRWVRGLSVENGRHPWVIYDRTKAFGKDMRAASDGASLDVEQTDHSIVFDYTVPVPATEFGGVLVTFMTIRPDETMAPRPDPVLASTWDQPVYTADQIGMHNHDRVTVRDLWSDCAAADEGTVAMHVGKNHLMKDVVDYGWARDVDTTTVENRSSIWQYIIPTSVTPENPLYPAEGIDHYPFTIQTADVAEIHVQSNARIDTPIIFGSTPIEEMPVLDTDTAIFEENENE